MPTQPLVTGLKHCNVTEELTPGDAYIMRFKNPLNEYKTDLWMAIILSDTREPGNRLHRRPKGAKPENGPWTTPLNERAYPVYMPGRNSYRFTAVHDLFLLEKNVPRIFAEGSDHEGAGLYRQLHEIARKAPGMDFWEQMANKETQAKGKRSRTLRLILPEGFSHILDENANEEDSTPGSPDSATIVEVDPEDAKGPRNIQAADYSPSNPYSFGSAERRISSSGAPVPLSFPGESSSFLSYVRGQPGRSLEADMNRTMSLSQIHSSAGKAKETEFPSMSLRHRDLCAPGGPREVHIKTEDSNNAASVEEKTAFDLSLRQALENIFLQKPDSAELLAIFTDTVAIQGHRGSEQIQSFLTTGEFVPRLVQVNNPTRIMSAAEGNEAFHQTDAVQVGDCYGFGRIYQLQGINNSDSLCQHILALGRLYQQARRFGLAALTSMIAMKLQVAWNSYPGLCQLEPLLAVVDMAFKDSPENKQDQLQAWLINFIAETLDLIYYSYSDRFWEVMHGKSSLQRIIFETRTKIVQQTPDKYTDPRVLLRSRGIGQV